MPAESLHVLERPGSLTAGGSDTVRKKRSKGSPSWSVESWPLAERTVTAPCLWPTTLVAISPIVSLVALDDAIGSGYLCDERPALPPIYVPSPAARSAIAVPASSSA